MRSNIDGLDDFADRALAHELARVNGRFHFEQLAVHDGVDALRFGNGLADIGQLFERRQSRLIGENVFPAFHGADGDSRALTGDLRGEHKLH